ncbi:hypothetical protein [Murimonas intestini]|uniref:hypothetical protein n=1 Tax=Murimonas intestini TaxID=1337051 RepID=UPI0011DD43C2|nr:hypothetical protein [Murimonas intestini]
MSRKKLVSILAGFLACMLLFTILSRAADSAGIANVQAEIPKNISLDHSVSGSGKVVQSREEAVSTLPDIKVDTIYVGVGSQVEANAALFDLNMEDIREQLLKKKQELKKMQLQAKDTQSRNAADAQKKAISQNQAAQDLGLAEERGNQDINAAAQNLETAKQKLEEYRKSQGKDTGADDTVRKQLETAVAEKTAALKSAQDELMALREKIEQEVKQAVEAQNNTNMSEAEEQKKKEESEKAALEEQQRQSESQKAAEEEQQRQSESQKAAEEQQRQSESQKAAEEEQQRQSESQNAAEEEQRRQSEAQKAAEEEQRRQSEAQKAAEEEQRRQSESQKAAEEEQHRQSEAQRAAEEEQQRQAEAQRAAEEEQQRQAEAQRAAEALPREQSYETGEQPSLEPDNTSAQAKLWKPSLSMVGSSQTTAADPAQAEQDVRNSYQADLDVAEQKVSDAQTALENAEAALSAYEKEKLEQEAANAEQEEQQLIEAVQSSQQAYDAAVLSKKQSVTSAAHSLESAGAPDGSDSSAEISALEQEALELEITKLERLEKENGQIKAPIAGIITKLSLTTGDKTPDGMAVLMADTSAGNKFTAQIPAGQEKYIARNDEVTLKPSGAGKQPITGLKVESVSMSEASEDMLDVTVNLPADALEIGEAAEFKVEKISKAYPLCVPISAVNEDSKEKFVYVLQETDSVLGTELTVRKVAVKVLDKNESYAALEEGSISSDQKIITGSDKNLSEGSRVRLNDAGAK